MGATKRSISVTRTYRPEADACLQALATLLKKSVSNEGSPSPATLVNDAKESKIDCAAESSIPESR